MQIHEIRAMNDQQLEEELTNSYRELMNLRFRAATNQLIDINMPQKTRRDIARLPAVLEDHLATRRREGEQGKARFGIGVRVGLSDRTSGATIAEPPGRRVPQWIR